MRLLDQKIESLDQEIEGVDTRTTAKIGALGEKLDGPNVRFTTKVGVDRELRAAIDIRERLAALEARRPSLAMIHCEDRDDACDAIDRASKRLRGYTLQRSIELEPVEKRP
jgi:ribosomal 50S subunit-associated protein YjgA (DUF615 family)